MVQEAADEPLRSVWEEVAEELARLAGALGVRTESVGDVLQDVYLSATRKRPKGIDHQQLRRWLIRVTVNRCNLEHRRKSRWTAVWRCLVERSNGAPTKETPREPSDIVARREERDLIQHALERMEPSLRNVLVLRYFADLNSMEIAQMLDMADSTVRGHLSKARKQLANKLKQAGYRHE